MQTLLWRHRCRGALARASKEAVLWIKYFSFCFLLLALSAVPLASQERYLPISESELLRLETRSAELELQSTQASQLTASLRTLLQTQGEQIATLSGESMILGKQLAQAKQLSEKSKTLYAGYVSGASLIIQRKSDEIARLKIWRTVALALAGLIFSYIALKIILSRLKII